MRLALVKLGARVAINSTSTSGGTGEALSLIKILVRGNNEVSVFTHILDKDESPEDFDIYEIEDKFEDIPNMGFDALVVVNGNVNFFGGAEDRSQILNYHIINHFPGKVFYFHCDADILLNQIWSLVEQKEWGSKYRREDIEITRDDIIYISQVRDFLPILSKAQKKIPLQKKNIHHFPFEKFPILNIDSRLPDLSSITSDLMYGGTFRGGKRQDDMIKFYWGYPEDISVKMFGKIKASNFNSSKIKDLSAPEFEKSVPYNQYHEKMMTSLSTIIIGDPAYKKTSNLAQRIYESILVGNITFIDKSYDHRRQVYSDPELVNFLYVRTREQVIDRIRKLKEDNTMILDIAKRQQENTRVDIEQYCSSLNILMESLYEVKD